MADVEGRGSNGLAENEIYIFIGSRRYEDYETSWCKLQKK
jgi:hypothetical protein